MKEKEQNNAQKKQFFKRREFSQEAFILFILTFTYVFAMTANIPFFWHDHVVVSWFSQDWEYQTLAKGIEFAFRPVQNLLYAATMVFFDGSETFLRIGKALATAGVAVFMYLFMWVRNEDFTIKQEVWKKRAILLLIAMYVLSTPLLYGVTLIYDAEVIVQLLLLLAVYVLFKRQDWVGKVFFVLLTYGALLIKESTKAFVVTYGIFVLFQIVKQNKKENKLNAVKEHFLPILFLCFITINPGFLIGLTQKQSGQTLDFLMRWFDWNNIIHYFNHLVTYCYGIIAAAVLTYMFKKKDTKKVEQENSKEKNITLFIIIWFVITNILIILVPLGDARYFVVPLLPMILVVGRWIRIVEINKRSIIAIILLLLACTAVTNAAMSAKYRYGNANFFIGFEKITNFNDEQLASIDAFIIHDYSTQYIEAKLPTIDVTTQNEWEKRETRAEENIFHLITKEKTQPQNTQVVETVVSGPHCFMLFEESDTDKDIQGAEQVNENEWLIQNSESNACSVQIETQYLIPGEITILATTETGTETTTIKPPVGKRVVCEYLCPETSEQIEEVQIISETKVFQNIYAVSLMTS